MAQERTRNVTQVESEVMEEEPQQSTDLELKQKLEERARRFAQPPPALSTTNMTQSSVRKRVSDTPAELLGPSAKQAKFLASKKAVTKAAVLQKRRELVAQQKASVGQRNFTEQKTEQKYSSAEALISAATSQVRNFLVISFSVFIIYK